MAGRQAAPATTSSNADHSRELKIRYQNERSLNLGKSSDGLGICKRHGLRAELLQFIANIFGGGMPLGIGTRIVHGEKKILWQPVNLA